MMRCCERCFQLVSTIAQGHLLQSASRPLAIFVNIQMREYQPIHIKYYDKISSTLSGDIFSNVFLLVVGRPFNGIGVFCR